MEKFSQRAFLALLLAALLAVPGGTALWSRKDTAAYYENRTLAQFPSLTAEGLWDGGLGGDFEDWYSDHVPGRTTLLKLDTAAQLNLLRRPAVNEVVPAEGVLLPLLPYEEREAGEYAALAAEAAEPFARLSEWVRAGGGTFYYVGIPEQRAYFRDRYPAYLSAHETEISAGDGAYARAMAEAGVDFLDMAAVYDAQGRPENYYSAVDHHYSYYGAYAAYRAILDRLAAEGWNLPVLTEEDLDFTELPNPYIATRNRKLYNLWPNGERAVIGVQKNPGPFTRYDNGELSDRPLFVLPEEDYLPTTYNLYMGGDFGETVLETDRPDLPDALIFGDSFTNALETLLYASFNETRILDLRHYDGMSLEDYIGRYRPEVVLCIQNDTFYYLSGGNNAVWEEP